MPTVTGTNVFTVNRDQIIKAALQTLRVIEATATPDASDVTALALDLNMLIKMWAATQGAFLWTLTTVSIPLLAAQVSYTIGPAGASVTADRPLRLLDGGLIRVGTGTTQYDTPMTMLSRLEYMQLSNKLAQSIPNCYYYDPQMGSGAYDPTTAKGTVYVWSVPSDATRTFLVQSQRQVYDMNSPTDNFDFPQEWFFALQYGLAAASADKFEIPEARMQRIEAKAAMYLKLVSDWASQEQAPFTFQPNTMGR